MNRPHPLSKLRKKYNEFYQDKILEIFSLPVPNFAHFALIVVRYSHCTSITPSFTGKLSSWRNATSRATDVPSAGGGVGAGVVALPSFRLGESGKT